MIRILLLLVAFVSFSAKADMDDVCFVTDKEFIDLFKAKVVINNSKCVRNNILTVYALNESQVINFIDTFCRYDRAINYMNRDSDAHKLPEKDFSAQTWGLTCVLYSPEGRSAKNPLSSTYDSE